MEALLPFYHAGSVTTKLVNHNIMLSKRGRRVCFACSTWWACIFDPHEQSLFPSFIQWPKGDGILLQFFFSNRGAETKNQATSMILMAA